MSIKSLMFLFAYVSECSIRRMIKWKFRVLRWRKWAKDTGHLKMLKYKLLFDKLIE